MIELFLFFLYLVPSFTKSIQVRSDLTLKSNLRSTVYRVNHQINQTAMLKTDISPFICYSTPPHYGSVFFRHCEQLARQIVRLDPHDRPKLFSEDATLADIELPATYKHESCSVALRTVEYYDDMDSFRLSELAASVLELAWGCARKRPFLGGHGPIGPRGVLDLDLSGVDWDRKPSDSIDLD